MKWTAEQVGRSYVIRLQGEFDEQAADRFRAHVDAVLEQGGIRDLVVVMRDVTFIDSSGLGALLGRYKRLQALGGRVRIVAPPRHVRAVLELSGVPKLIPILRSERQALDAG
ncbi:MAG: anti-sigma factor antagonist [Thermaerobacter sp.]|nr:anti-sigma F factor antagonist [Bacillota bacterium]REJ35227.1 MAG: anti-sigma F factor antagonist [Bacillota bacterium]